MTYFRRDESRLRLCYLINGLGPGGAERSLADLLPYYDAAGIDTTIVCLRHREIGVAEDIRHQGTMVRMLGQGSLLAKSRELRKILLADGFDLVHTTLFESDIVGRIAAAGTGIPVLTSLVNTTYDPARRLDPNVRPLSLWVTRLVDSWTARFLTARFHAITMAVRDSAVRTMSLRPDRITVVGRGRSVGRLGTPSLERKMASRAALGLSVDDPVLVTVGRQEYQKGHRHLLQAMPEVLQRYPRTVLLIAGREGHATPELQRLHSELQLGDAARFLGHRDDVADIMAAGDLFVFPSVCEGLGGAVIEAMGLRLPVVASDLPCLREVVEEGDSGILVPPTDSSHLAGAIQRLLENRETAERYGARGQAIFHEKFDLSRCARQMVELYRSMVSPERSATQQLTRA